MRSIFLALLAFSVLAGNSLWLLPASLAGDQPTYSEPTGPWHPEITARPRLLFDASALPVLQNRLTREPYITLMARAQGWANSGFDPNPPSTYDPIREYTNSNIAKDAAFVGWVNQDATMADKSARVLEAMATDFGVWTLDLMDNDVHVAEAVMNYCQAYDILAGSGLVDSGRLQAIETNLGAMVANLYHEYIDLLASVVNSKKNNHHIKIAAAVGLAGMTLNQRSDANKWVNYGITDAYDLVFNRELVDGEFAEGPYYGTYSAANFMPLFIAYDRLVGLNATLLRRGTCVIGPNCSWYAYSIINPMDHPRLKDMSSWYVKTRMPDGSSPPIEDSEPWGYFNGLTAATWQNGLFDWEWLNNTRLPYFSDHAADLSVDAIAQYDDSVASTPPGSNFGPDFVSTMAGYAAFRSGWGTGDTYALFLAENGAVRVNGGGHQHGDNLSVSLFARGQYLLMDPGYIDWGDHELVRLGKHHDVPTVDGNGPPAPSALFQRGGADAFITDFLTRTVTPFVTGRSSWNGANITRTVLLPDTDYLLTLDDLQSTRSHTYGVLWQGQGGGNSGYPFTQLSDGGRWSPGNANVEVHVANNLGGLAIATPINVHSFNYGQQIQHNTLDARSAVSGPRARFISVAVPYASDESARQVTWIRQTNLIAARIAGSGTDFALAQNDNTERSLLAADTGSVDINTSARTLLARTQVDAASGSAYLAGAGDLQFNHGRQWVVQGQGRVWLDWTGDTWTFQLATGGNTLTTTYTQPPVITGDPGVQYTLDNGTLRVWATTGATFTVAFGE